MKMTKRDNTNGKDIVLQAFGDKLITGCQQSLQMVLDNKGLRIRSKVNDHYCYVVGDNTNALATDDEGSHQEPVVLIAQVANDDCFWLGVSIQLENYGRGLCRLCHIRLSIYKGLYDPRKTKVFRAEWEFKKSDSGIAQPHWHFHNWSIQETDRIGSIDRWQDEPSQIEEFGAEKEYKPIGRLDDFHFPMSSTWHSNGTCTIQCKNETEVRYWLRSCVEYIRNELLSIYTKGSD